MHAKTRRPRSEDRSSRIADPVTNLCSRGERLHNGVRALDSGEMGGDGDSIANEKTWRGIRGPSNCWFGRRCVGIEMARRARLHVRKRASIATIATGIVHRWKKGTSTMVGLSIAPTGSTRDMALS